MVSDDTSQVRYFLKETHQQGSKLCPLTTPSSFLLPLFFLPTLPFSPHLFTVYIPAGAKVTEHLLGYRGGLDPLWIQEGLDLLGHSGGGWLAGGGWMDV